MTKKHFIALANRLRTTKPTAVDIRNHMEVTLRLKQWEQDRDMLADFCQSQNSRFDRSRWLAYIADECGPNGGTR